MWLGAWSGRDVSGFTHFFFSLSQKKCQWRDRIALFQITAKKKKKKILVSTMSSPKVMTRWHSRSEPDAWLALTHRTLCIVCSKNHCQIRSSSHCLGRRRIEWAWVTPPYHFNASIKFVRPLSHRLCWFLSVQSSVDMYRCVFVCVFFFVPLRWRRSHRSRHA